MTNYFTETMKTLTAAVNSMKPEEFDRLVNECVRTLDSAGKIVISGLGKNVPICEKFVGTMLSLGLDANFMHTNSAVHGDIGMVKLTDLVIVLSKSGETMETKCLVDRLRERDAKIWLLTFNKDAPLVQKVHGTLALELENEGDEWNLVPNNSSSVNLIVLQGLALEIAKRRNVGLEEFKRNHPGGHIGEVLRNV